MVVVEGHEGGVGGGQQGLGPRVARVLRPRPRAAAHRPGGRGRVVAAVTRGPAHPRHRPARAARVRHVPRSRAAVQRARPGVRLQSLAAEAAWPPPEAALLEHVLLDQSGVSTVVT